MGIRSSSGLVKLYRTPKQYKITDFFPTYYQFKN